MEWLQKQKKKASFVQPQLLNIWDKPVKGYVPLRLSEHFELFKSRHQKADYPHSQMPFITHNCFWQPASQQINVFTQQFIYVVKYTIYINFFLKYIYSSEICILCNFLFLITIPY